MHAIENNNVLFVIFVIVNFPYINRVYAVASSKILLKLHDNTTYKLRLRSAAAAHFLPVLGHIHLICLELCVTGWIA